jgi:8-oxo-dGTP diphosphatase
MRKAVVILIRSRGRFLVIRRAAGVTRPGWWSPPSGRLEADESASDAAVREAQEELGIVVRPIAQVWVCPTDDGSYELAWWLVEADEVALTPAPDEVAEVRWVTPAEFLELSPIFDAHRVFFSDVESRLSAWA